MVDRSRASTNARIVLKHVRYAGFDGTIWWSLLLAPVAFPRKVGARLFRLVQCRGEYSVGMGIQQKNSFATNSQLLLVQLLASLQYIYTKILVLVWQQSDARKKSCCRVQIRPLVRLGIFPFRGVRRDGSSRVDD